MALITLEFSYFTLLETEGSLETRISNGQNILYECITLLPITQQKRI
jgi:hypothetical protein